MSVHFRIGGFEFRTIDGDEVIRDGHWLQFGSGATRIVSGSPWIGKTLMQVVEDNIAAAKAGGYEPGPIVILERVE